MIAAPQIIDDSARLWQFLDRALRQSIHIAIAGYSPRGDPREGHVNSSLRREERGHCRELLQAMGAAETSYANLHMAA
jgi:hypothetical protein